MKYEFLKKEGRESLILFFGGWGSGPELFSSCPVAHGYDLLFCYDYRNPAFDGTVISGYSDIRILAWSMGVFVADMSADSIVSGKVSGVCSPLRIERSIAVGGTLFPVDDRFGIPRSVFSGTLENMSDGRIADAVLSKFRRRMCGKGLEYYMSHLPRRRTEELAEELYALYSAVSSGRSCGSLRWDIAVIGENDLIFPPSNQLAAWALPGRLRAGKTVMEHAAHFDINLFSELTGGTWTKY